MLGKVLSWRQPWAGEISIDGKRTKEGDGLDEGRAMDGAKLKLRKARDGEEQVVRRELGKDNHGRQ